jgi:hypothetical protein
MAIDRREQIARVLLVAFVVTCVGLALLNWAAALGGADRAPATSLLRRVTE